MIPDGDSYKLMHELVDFEDLAKPLEKLYSKLGRKAYPPASGLKCLLLQFLEDLSASRRCYLVPATGAALTTEHRRQVLLRVSAFRQDTGPHLLLLPSPKDRNKPHGQTVQQSWSSFEESRLHSRTSSHATMGRPDIGRKRGYNFKVLWNLLPTIFENS